MAIDPMTAVDVVRVSMQLEEARAKVAARNISMANVPGSHAIRFDIASAMQMLHASLSDADTLASAVMELNSEGVDSRIRTPSGLSTRIELDEEVAELSSASGRYQALADGVSRQFALMQLAVKGGK
ncbi:MAG: hypothetical protein Q7T36_08445 [Fluviicoccus sp.]|uniref:hypothetical protein n=1 Tax=Fluviicoccus sp. TaxID=2003552 RepID=UPI0027211A30|nr:hypothetical protein [Fluviicoccus sp.]MDO8330483.1 hypothetical protein [Fluviicoccus sp.]